MPLVVMYLAENFDDVEYLTEDLSMRKRFDDNFHQAIAK